jgi:hypothetical protein
MTAFGLLCGRSSGALSSRRQIPQMLLSLSSPLGGREGSVLVDSMVLSSCHRLLLFDFARSCDVTGASCRDTNRQLTISHEPARRRMLDSLLPIGAPQSLCFPCWHQYLSHPGLILSHISAHGHMIEYHDPSRRGKTSTGFVNSGPSSCSIFQPPRPSFKSFTMSPICLFPSGPRPDRLCFEVK